MGKGELHRLAEAKQWPGSLEGGLRNRQKKFEGLTRLCVVEKRGRGGRIKDVSQLFKISMNYSKCHQPLESAFETEKAEKGSDVAAVGRAVSLCLSTLSLGLGLPQHLSG